MSLFDDYDDDFSVADEGADGNDFDYGIEDDEFDQLRDSSARADDYGDDLVEDDESGESGGGVAGYIASFTPMQRLVLALLVFIDIIAVGVSSLIVFGVI